MRIVCSRGCVVIGLRVRGLDIMEGPPKYLLRAKAVAFLHPVASGVPGLLLWEFKWLLFPGAPFDTWQPK
jgi:hypothetical protein